MIDNKTDKIAIHIGYPKAASTTLQKHLFNKHSDINNLGVYPTANLGRDSNEIDYNCIFLQNDNLRYFYNNLLNLDKENSIEQYINKIYPLLDNKKINVFSNERFTSVFFTPVGNLEAKAELLQEFFPQAQIIIVIRNQFKSLESQYRDWPFDPNSLTKGKPVSFSDWVQIAYEKDHIIGYLQSLKYDEIFNIYAKLFGDKKVKVLLFEDLVSNLTLFSKDISNFLEIEFNQTKLNLESKHENISVTSRFNKYRKLKRSFPLLGKIENKLLFQPTMKRKWSEFIKSGKKANYSLSKSAKQLIHSYFQESNDNLLKINQALNLQRYNYPLESRKLNNSE